MAEQSRLGVLCRHPPIKRRDRNAKVLRHVFGWPVISNEFLGGFDFALRHQVLSAPTLPLNFAVLKTIVFNHAALISHVPASHPFTYLALRAIA